MASKSLPNYYLIRLLNMKKVLIYSRAEFNRGAPYRRVQQLSFLYKNAGYDVVVYCLSNSEAFSELAVLNGVVFKSGGPSKQSIKEKIRFLFFEFRFLKRALEAENADAICVYSTISYFCARKIIRYALSRGQPLFWDVVEARKPFQSKRLKSNLGYNIHNYLINTTLLKRPIRVSVASKFLEQYFKSKGMDTFYFPITMSVPDTQPIKPTNGKINFLYSGTSGEKDMLFEILKAFLLVPDKYLNNLSLVVCGSGTASLNFARHGINPDGVARLNEFARFLGLIDLDEMKNVLSSINFSLLLRDENSLMSKAGFPTKISEALSNGIVPICNISGDLGNFLVDGINSYICENHSAVALSDQIVRACEEFETHYKFLSRQAHMTAYTKLNLNSFVDGFKSFVRN